MTISIRPHHLLCMLTYLGKGYTPDFVGNYSGIIKRLNAGEMIAVVSGPDEICEPMLQEATCHCLNESVIRRDLEAATEIGHLLDRNFQAGDRFVLTGEALQALRSAFASGKIRSACTGCEWAELCSDIASNNYRGCRLRLAPA